MLDLLVQTFIGLLGREEVSSLRMQVIYENWVECSIASCACLSCCKASSSCAQALEAHLGSLAGFCHPPYAGPPHIVSSGTLLSFAQQQSAKMMSVDVAYPYATSGAGYLIRPWLNSLSLSVAMALPRDARLASLAATIDLHYDKSFVFCQNISHDFALAVSTAD